MKHPFWRAISILGIGQSLLAMEQPTTINPPGKILYATAAPAAQAVPHTVTPNQASNITKTTSKHSGNRVPTGQTSKHSDDLQTPLVAAHDSAHWWSSHTYQEEFLKLYFKRKFDVLTAKQEVITILMNNNNAPSPNTTSLTHELQKLKDKERLTQAKYYFKLSCLPDQTMEKKHDYARYAFKTLVELDHATTPQDDTLPTDETYHAGTIRL